MILILAAIAIAAAGFVLGLPRRLIAGLFAGLYAVALLVHGLWPADSGVVRAVGGSLRGWLGLGVAGLLVAGYRVALGRLHQRAAGLPVAVVSGAFAPAELERYARHIVLREIGGPGQRKLKDARVLVVGAGGLGAPALMYLAAAGVGTIGVIDDDTVAASNLQRQIIHADARIGMAKVFSAEVAMKAVNPFVTVRPYKRRLTADIAPALFADYDLIIDGCDNFQTRYLVNAVAVQTGKPLIAGAIAQWEGQVTLYDPAHDAPCFACIFPEAPAEGLAPSCAEAGVMGALPGVVGSMIATEAIKEITGAGESLRGRMLIYDALYAENRVMRLKRRADCAVCGGLHA